MSQIPNTTFLETPVANTPVARRTAAPISLPGVQNTLNAPGLEVKPPVSEGARLAAEALEALGLTAGLANAVRVYSDRAKVLQQGQGNSQADGDISSIQQKIESGEIARIDGLTSGQQAEVVISGYTSGMPEAVVAGYRGRAKFAIASAFSGVDSRVIKEARDQSLMDAGSLAESATTPEELALAVDAAKGIPGVSEIDASRATLLSALEHKARTGDRKGFEMVKAAIPASLFTVQKARADEILQRELSQRQNEADNAATDTIGGMLFDLERGKGGSFEQITDKLDELAPAISGAKQNQLLKQINAEQGRYVKATQDASIERQSAEARAGLHIYLDELEQNGLLLTTEPVKIVRGPDGTVRVNDPTFEGGTTLLSVSREDAIQMQTERAFKTIEKNADGDPSLAIRMQAQWASRQGVSPPKWNQMLTAGMSAATMVNAVTGAGRTGGSEQSSKSFEVAPTTAAGIELYRTVKAVAPTNTLHQIVKDERTRDFYEAVLMAESVPQVGSPTTALTPEEAQARQSQAVLTASLVLDGRSGVSIDARAVQETVARELSTGNWWAAYYNGEEPANGGEIASEVGRYMTFYSRLGKDADSALKLAKEKVFSERVMMPGGWSVSLAGVPVPEGVKKDLPPLAASIIRAWFESEGEAGGYEEDRLTFAPESGTGWWAIRDLNGFPVASKAATGVVFAPHQLTALHNTWQKQKLLDADKASRAAKAAEQKALQEFGERARQFDNRTKQ